ncbi:MAG: outer membrane protein assembly factor BamD, partial [Gammaproteobacteria bacterium]|nr:outer membrane protein assembly factor BamD [Gammaproteobacteria bacterium]
KDAEQRLVHLRNRLAKYEIFVAQYYLKRDANVAALNRGKYVLENYQQTPAIADALVIMVKAYRKMDMPDLADDTFRVLSLNAPGHPELLTLSNKKAR